MTTLQAEQRELLEDAASTAGVKEAAEVYDSISKLLSTPIMIAAPHMAYATGGNSVS